MASTLTLQQVVRYAQSFPELSPVFPASGWTQEPALSIANDMMQEFLQEGMNWKFNSALLNPFLTVSLQQDYIGVSPRFTQPPAPGTPVTPTFVQQQDITATSNPFTITLGTAPTPGNLLVMMMLETDSSHSGDTWTPTGFTNIYSNYFAGALNNSYANVWTRTVQAGDSASVVVNSTESHASYRRFFVLTEIASAGTPAISAGNLNGSGATPALPAASNTAILFLDCAIGGSVTHGVSPSSFYNVGPTDQYTTNSPVQFYGAGNVPASPITDTGASGGGPYLIVTIPPATAAALVTNQSTLDLCWLEHGTWVDINNTSIPKPQRNMECKKNLDPTSLQGIPFKLSWLPNNQATYGAWQANTYYPPGTGYGITQALTSPIQQIVDANGNFLYISSYGSTAYSGSTQPLAAIGAPPGTQVPDGSLTWTVADPLGAAIRVWPLPPISGLVWQILTRYQKKPPILTSLQNTFAPIPDEYAHLIRAGFIAHAKEHANPGSKAAILAKQTWTEQLMRTLRGGDREEQDASMYPTDSLQSGGIMSTPIGPAWPYRY